MFTVGIITSSDKGYRGEREDKSGQVIEEIVSQNGFKVIKKVVFTRWKRFTRKRNDKYVWQLKCKFTFNNRWNRIF